jgi:septal ring factor EnvC (AmiA/AmiB activator)
VHPLLAPGLTGQREVMARLRWLRQGAAGDLQRPEYAFRAELPHTAKPVITPAGIERRLTKVLRETQKQLRSTQEQLVRVQRQLDETQTQLKRQSKIIKRLDVPMATRARRYLSRLRRRALARSLRRS